MKILVVAEKPSMGRTIAAVIEPKGKNHKTYIEGEKYIISWAIGHLLELADPDKYDSKYKRWTMNDLPIIPPSFKLVPNYKTRDQLKVIGDLAKRADRIINACDAGREGQLIFHLIFRYLKLKHPVNRLWISDLTPETIRQGFLNLKDESHYSNLTKAAQARSEADWLVGINGSRALTVKYKDLLSVGRVQTPVLALIYDRQREIETFHPETYFEVFAEFQQESIRYKGKWQGEKLSDKGQAEKILEKVNNKPGRIESNVTKDTKEYPFKLFDLTLLQREANARYHFSAKKTLDIAQALYEKHKVITYPRTNSNYVTEQNIPEMHRTLEALRGTDYHKWVEGAQKSLVHKNNKSICNPTKVEDHHAILPTMKKAGKLTPDEQKIYDLIVRRFLAQFYPAAEYKLHTIISLVEEERFKTQVKERVSEGWKIVYADWAKEKDKKPQGEEPEETDGSLTLNSELPVFCQKAKIEKKETKPPSMYNEGTLLKAMESAGKQVENEELREVMKDSGLGTPATRAAIIERLKKVGYIETAKRQMMITTKGRSTIERIRHAGIQLLTSPEMTGQWERRLHEISRGSASETGFMERVKTFTSFIVDQVKQQPITMDSTEITTPAHSKESATIPCPREGCKGQLFLGKKAYGCSLYKEGCKFVIWKQSFGKSLTLKMVKDLILKGKTNKLKFTSKNGTPYEAKLVLKDKNSGQLELEFAKKLSE